MPRPARTSTARFRQAVQINSRLDKSLTAYMVAAGAAGVGMLGLAVPAQARIIYTSANKKIGPNAGLVLDLNHDGIADFVFSDFYSSTSSTLNLSVAPAVPSNEIFSTGANVLSVFASALPAGAKIGTNSRFKKRLFEGMANGEDIQGVCQGPWIHANERYLGLKFIITGEVHFGWARLDVRCDYPHAIHGVLTGYAYETVANKPIVAGDTEVTDASVDSRTLGNLARGSAAIPNRRNEPTPQKIH